MYGISADACRNAEKGKRIKVANNAKTRIVFNVILKLVWDASSPFRKYMNPG